MQWFTLSQPVQLAIGGILGVLGVATLVVAVLRATRPGRDWTELTQRMTTWWVLIVLFVGAIVSSRGVAIAFFWTASFLAFKEYLSLIPTRRADRRVLFWAYLAIPLQYYWVYSEWFGVFIIFIPVYMFLFLPLRMISIGETEGYLRAAGTLHWGLMTTVFSLSHAAFLLILRFADGSVPAPGPGLVIFLVALTQLNDVAQYVWGKSFGRKKIVPSVSPGKTWVGFLGGVGTSVALAFVVGPLLTPMNYVQSLGAGLIISMAGFVGDVNMSALKRDLHVKDSGTMLPGHGGILDRVDSLTYTAPLFFHYVYWMFTFHTFGLAPHSP